MPGAVPITSTYALTNATMPYVLHLASDGLAAAIAANPGLKLGVNVAGGQITYEPVANAVGEPWTAVDEALSSGTRAGVNQRLVREPLAGGGGG
jgi:alanine dehydrogenase